MNDNDYQELKIQLEEYKQEKERVRNIVGQIGSRRGSRYHKIIDQLFLMIVLFVFVAGVIFRGISYNIALQLGILFACIKVIWMVNEQQKINHFQFWILSTIELRINEIDKKLNKEFREKRQKS
jgi:hypothetical protein